MESLETSTRTIEQSDMSSSTLVAISPSHSSSAIV